MKILLLGEFSGVYSELKIALKNKGHEVFHIAGSDGFKGYSSDLDVSAKHNNAIVKAIGGVFGLLGITKFVKIWKTLKNCSKGYDAVQISTPYVFNYGYLILLFYYRFLKKHNGRIYLSILGANYYVKKYNIRNHVNRIYKEMSFQARVKDTVFSWTERILTDYLNKICSAVIPISYGYKRVYDEIEIGKPVIFIPICVNDDKIGEALNINGDDKIVIFHGWQTGREKDKGNDVFDRVVKKVMLKYKDKIDYEVVHNVPYENYIKMFSKCHLFIDQLYATDKGMNGLLGMAAGKVVFSGFKAEALKLYPGYKGQMIGIESHEDEKDLYNKFVDVIENPDKINEISKNAIEFVKKYHLSDIVAQQYIHIWQKYA